MIRLTNLADYAVVIMSHAAARPDAKHSAHDMSECTAIPVPTVSKIMGALARRGILASHRGIGGGFSLAHPPAEISVVDIIEAVDGPIALTNCVEQAPGDCSLESLCSMRPHWQMLNKTVRDALASVSLAQVTALPNMFETPSAQKAQDLMPVES